MSAYPIDPFSHALGVCEAFAEVVRAGVKRIALSHPFTEEELCTRLHGQAFLDACDAIAAANGCKAYYLREPVLTDLFPISLNWGKQNVIFYRDPADIEELLAIQCEKNALQAVGKYAGEARRALAVRYGRLLSYSDEAIERYLRSNTDLE